MMILQNRSTRITNFSAKAFRPIITLFERKALFRNASTLVFVEHKNDKIIPSSLCAVKAAIELSTINNNEIDLLLIGSSLNNLAAQLKKCEKINKIIKVDHESLKNIISKPYARVLLSIFNKKKDYSHIIGAHSNAFKDVGFRFSGLVDVQPISDVIKIEKEDVFVRPIYAGNAISKVKTNQKLNVLSVRGTAFEPVSLKEENKDVVLEDFKVDEETLKSETEFVEEKIKASDRPELSSSPRIVSGGRGLKSGENFDLLYKLADKLNAAVGASRAAVDAGYVDNSLQVGQTGKIVAPELYVAVGISGAIQHLAGMKDSKTIVAINKDADAPIFQIADYGLVGDLFKVVPELTEKL